MKMNLWLYLVICLVQWVSPTSSKAAECARLNREVLADGRSCGRCLQGYRRVGNEEDVTKQCWFQALTSASFNGQRANKVERFVEMDVEEKGEDKVAVRQVQCADVDGDGHMECIRHLLKKGRPLELFSMTEAGKLEKNGKDLVLALTPFPEKDLLEFKDYLGFTMVDLEQAGKIDIVASVCDLKAATSPIYFANKKKMNGFEFERTPLPGLENRTFHCPTFVFVDLNNDTSLDLAVATSKGEILCFSKNNETWTEDPDLCRGLENVGGVEVSFFDIDNDSDVDAFVSTHTEILFFRNDGNGIFTEVKGFLNPFFAEDDLGYGIITFHDFDGSKVPQALVGTHRGIFLYRYDNETIGELKFTRIDSLDSRYKVLTQINGTFPHVALRDIDNDGFAEAIFGSSNIVESERVIRRFDNVNGTFVPLGEPIPYVPKNMWQEIFPAFNATGDLFVGTYDSGVSEFNYQGGFEFEMNRNFEDPSFDKKTFLLQQSVKVTFVDYDGDGDDDLFLTFRDYEILYLENKDGEFVRRTNEKPFAGLPKPLFDNGWYNIAFLDGANMAFIADFGGAIHLMRKNHSNGEYELDVETNPLINACEAIQGCSLSFGDIDGDGDKDLIMGAFQKMLVFINSQVECTAQCLGRGNCGNGATDSSMSVVAAANFQGLRSTTNAVGQCSCFSDFRGSSCEKCAWTQYGPDCAQTCPDYSRVEKDYVFPEYPTIKDCKCLQGFVSVETSDGGFSCQCPVGSELDERNAKCVPCMKNFFKNNVSLSECIPCSSIGLGERKETRTVGSSAEDDCVCPEQFVLYNGKCVCGYDLFLNDRGFCEPCPSPFHITLKPGATSLKDCVSTTNFFTVQQSSGEREARSCSSPEFDGRVACEQQGLVVEKLPIVNGYWRISTTSVNIRSCDNPKYCASPDESKNHRLCPGPNCCVENHIGMMCEQCVEGYTLKPSTGCQYCSDEMILRDKAKAICWLVIIVIIGCIPAIFVARKMKRSELSCFDQLATRCLGHRKKHYKFYMHLVKAKGRILLAFYQILFITLYFMNVFYSPVGSTVANLDFSVILKFLDVGCFWEMDYYSFLMAKTLYPLCVVFLAWLVAHVLMLFLKGDENVDQRNSIWLTFLFWLFLVIFAVFPMVSSDITGTFLVEPFPHFKNAGPENTTFVLMYDVTVDATSSRSAFFTAYAGVMYVIYLGGVFGLFLLTTFWRQRGSHDTLAAASGMLTFAYKKDYFWYETFELVRKFVQTSLFAVAYRYWDHNAALITAITIHFVFLLVLVKLNPFAIPSDQSFAMYSQTLLLFTIYLFAIIPSTHGTWQYAISVTICVVEFFLFMYFVSVSIRSDDERIKIEATENGTFDEAAEKANEQQHGDEEVAERKRFIEEPSKENDPNLGKDEVLETPATDDETNTQQLPPKPSMEALLPA